MGWIEVGEGGVIKDVRMVFLALQGEAIKHLKVGISEVDVHF